jgi:predicted branched-subunit amino acid permease
MTTTCSTRRPAGRGAAAMAPLALGLVPLAVFIGTAAAASPVPDLAGWASGPLLFGGTAQLVSIEMLGSGAGVVAVVATVLLVNARLAVYSATIAPSLAHQPRWFRVAAPYFVVDPVVATTADVLEAATGAGPARAARRYYLGAVGLLWFVWVAGITVGVLAGPVVDPAWSLDAVGPLCLLALLGPKLRRRATRRPIGAAAVVGGAASVLPAGIGVLLALPVAMALTFVGSEEPCTPS